MKVTSTGFAGLETLMIDVPDLTPNKAYSFPFPSTYPQISLYPEAAYWFS
jgi:hypothetical protein